MLKKICFKKIIWLLVCHLALASLALASPDVELKVGAIYGLTGPLVSLSSQYKNGALLAQEALKQKGIAIDITFEDSQWQAKGAVTAYKKLRQAGDINIIHVLGSPMTLALKPLTEADRVLLYSAAAHSEILANSK